MTNDSVSQYYSLVYNRWIPSRVTRDTFNIIAICSIHKVSEKKKKKTPRHNWNPQIHRQGSNNLWGVASIVDAQEVKYFDNHNQICAIQQHE